MDKWICDWDRDARLPFYTRANAGEVLPDPASPLGWTLVFEQGLLIGWRQGFVDFGIYQPDELSVDRPGVAGLFGGYFYLNLSHMRLLGLRMGMEVADFDAALLGSHPDAPSYVERPGDRNEECSAKVAQTIGEIVSASHFPKIDEDRARTSALRGARPNLRELSDGQLVDYARSFLGELDNAFAVHDFSSLASTIGPAMLAGLAGSVGRPELVLELISGLGDVESASPSWGLWDLSRQANSSTSVTALFDQGPEAVYAALANPADEQVAAFAESFENFLFKSGSRGPNEWDIHALSWESDPVQPLRLVNSIRHASDSDSPAARHERLAARREAALQQLRAALGDNSEALATLDVAMASTSLCVPARERTKATSVAVINEVRMAIRELGRRGVEAGLYAKPEDVMMLLAGELDEYVAHPASFKDTIAQRLADYEWLYTIEPPFIIKEDPLPLEQWTRRERVRMSPLGQGDVLVGLGGGAGRYSGRVCVINDPSDPGDLEPGDILVAPLTDAAWTPLFLVAGAVVVDVGAMNSHAVVVCRELGIPCVLSVQTGTEQLRNGMHITVDGTAGTVTVDSVESAVAL